MSILSKIRRWYFRDKLSLREIARRTGLSHDEQDVLTVVELPPETGSPSKQIVINILSRLVEGTPIPPIEVLPALALRVEPPANVTCYDNL